LCVQRWSQLIGCCVAFLLSRCRVLLKSWLPRVDELIVILLLLLMSLSLTALLLWMG